MTTIIENVNVIINHKDILREMLYPKRTVEDKIANLEQQIAIHLIKIIGFSFTQETKNHFRIELKTWLILISRLRMKPKNRTLSATRYYELLYDYPFGQIELQTLNYYIDNIINLYPDVKLIDNPTDIIKWLQYFYQELSVKLSHGENVLDLIP